VRVEKPKAFPGTAWQVNELKRLSIIFGFGTYTFTFASVCHSSR
jgi:hypothetical protein